MQNLESKQYKVKAYHTNTNATWGEDTTQWRTVNVWAGSPAEAFDIVEQGFQMTIVATSHVVGYRVERVEHGDERFDDAHRFAWGRGVYVEDSSMK